MIKAAVNHSGVEILYLIGKPGKPIVDIAGYGKVRERGMEWLSRPAPEPVELTTSEGYRRPDRKPTSHIYVLLALLTRQLLNWTPL
jgi:hypothetical protein